MNTRDTTLQEFLFPQGGVPDQVWTKVLRNPAVIPVLAGFAVNIVDGVKAQIKDSIGTLFQMSLLDVLVGGWKKYADVSQALEKSKQTPNDTVLESMANHTFKSVHHPYIALYRADVQVAKIEFETTVSLNVEGVQLRIRNGDITGILTGACQGTITLALAGQVLSEAQTGKIALPGSVAIKPPAAQADSAGAVPEEQAARVQVEKVQAAPSPVTDPGAQKQAAQNPFIKPLPELSKPSAQKPPPPPPPAAPPPAKPPRKSNNAVLVIGIIVVLCICISAAALILVLVRPPLIAQVNPTNPPVVATVPVLPPAPTSAPVPSAPTVPPAPTVAVPPALPTTAPAAPPTAAPPTTAPAAPPTAAPPTAAPPTAAPPTAAPAAPPTTAPAAPTLPPPGLYVTSMGMDQAQPMHGQLVNFTVSFLNTTGGDQGVKWRVYIYRADTPTRTNTDSAPVQVTLHPGSTLDQPVPMNFKYGSSGNVCDYFYARVDTVDNNNNPTGELAAPNGKVFQKDFTVCN